MNLILDLNPRKLAIKLITYLSDKGFGLRKNKNIESCITYARESDDVLIEEYNLRFNGIISLIDMDCIALVGELRRRGYKFDNHGCMRK